MANKSNIRGMTIFLAGAVLTICCLSVSHSADTSPISAKVNVDVNAVDLAELIGDWVRDILKWREEEKSEEIRNQIPVFITKLNILSGRKKALAASLIAYANSVYPRPSTKDLGEELKDINRILRSLTDIIEELDPNWGVQNQDKVRMMSHIVYTKGLILRQAQRGTIVLSNNPETTKEVARLFTEEADKLADLADQLTESITQQ